MMFLLESFFEFFDKESMLIESIVRTLKWVRLVELKFFCTKNSLSEFYKLLKLGSWILEGVSDLVMLWFWFFILS